MYSRAAAICSYDKGLKEEINYTVNDFYKNAYKNKHVRNIICKFVRDSDCGRDSIEVKGNIIITYVRGTSEKIITKTAFHNTIGMISFYPFRVKIGLELGPKPQ